VAGAALAGAACALLARTLPDAGNVTAAAHDVRAGAFLLAACVLVVVAGLVLERAGIDPGSDERNRR
jgi:Na+/H+ antiporter NhaD/arsenite permease-like protein